MACILSIIGVLGFGIFNSKAQKFIDVPDDQIILLPEEPEEQGAGGGGGLQPSDSP